ncbi:MAG TPA: VTT domain-containing protein, partial [Stellaceae bacterium]|nr:VTT domain-containing protein [Stellaceae bacterium]
MARASLAGVTAKAEIPGPRQSQRRTAAVVAAVTLVAIVAVLALAWRALGIDGTDLQALTAEQVESFVAQWQPWSWLGSIVLMVLHSFLPLPAEFIAIANGILFGPFWGVVVTWVGAMLGAILSFALARTLGLPLLRWAVPPRHWERIEKVPMTAGPLLAVRLMPVISFNLVNYAAGVLGVSWWTF